MNIFGKKKKQTKIENAKKTFLENGKTTQKITYNPG